MTADSPVRNRDKPLSVEQQLQAAEVAELTDALVSCFSRLGNSRELSLAVTKVEEAAFWALKHIGAITI
jgi:hypothetical protein